ncbi:MAG: glycosyltransferase family 4 protein [Elusimicrobiota bacterium]
MKLIYIAISKIPYKTAHTLLIMKMCEAFKQCGIDVILIIPEYGNNDSTDDIFNFYGTKHKFEIIKIPFKKSPAPTLRFAYKAIRIAKNVKANFVVSMINHVVIWATLFKIPFIIDLHGRPFSLMEKLSLKISNYSKSLIKIVTVTQTLKNWYIKWGIQPNNIIVLPNGADIELFPEVEYFDWKNGMPLKVGYSGHLYKGKGMEIIVEIAKYISDAEFIIIGGLEEDIHYWKNKTKDILNIKFLGFIPNTKIPEMLNRLDILLLPNQRNVFPVGGKEDIGDYTSPMKMFEYMATGKPIIASDLPVLKEVLKDKINSILVPHNKPEEWINAIKFVQQNPELALKIGQQARKEVEEKYNWATRAKTLIEHFKR